MENGETIIPLNEICRLCLNTNSSLMYPIKETVFDGNTITDLLDFCVAIRAETFENYPPNICNNCTKTLLDICKFKNKCHENQKLLETELVTLMVKEEIDISDTKISSPVVQNEIKEANNAKDLIEIKVEKVTGTQTKPKKAPHRKQLLCDFCGKFFTSHKMTLHMRTHTQERPYKCNICSESFQTKRNLSRHEMLHTGERPFFCTFCQMGFIQALNLKQHLSKHEIGTPIDLKCKYCSKTCANEKELAEHLPTHRFPSKSLKPRKPLKNRSLTCSICSRRFKTPYIREHHELTHGEKQLLCNLCGQAFYLESALDRHLKLHTGEKSFSCKICQKTFSQMPLLRIHELIHSGKRPYKCKICSKTFIQGSHLYYHEKVHRGEKAFECVHCNKKFTQKGNLVAHIRTHTGEKPYVCSVCNQGFIRLSYMKKHEKSHDVESAEK